MTNGSSTLPPAALAMAHWIASQDNPLTARVMANRVWQHLFGAGIVLSTDNFGALGDEPSHPELLDHLAVQFMKEGWSVKRLIRQVMLSRAYQLDSRFDARNNELDPDNVLVWRMSEPPEDYLRDVTAGIFTAFYVPFLATFVMPRSTY